MFWVQRSILLQAGELILDYQSAFAEMSTVSRTDVDDRLCTSSSAGPEQDRSYQNLS